jgi:hypothetical protein
MQDPIETDASILIEFRVNAGATGLADSEAQFHNVVAVGYTPQRRIVGEEPVGTVGLSDEQSVTLRCSDMPDYLTFITDESGCQYETTISIYRINPPDSDVSYTKAGEKHCSDPELLIPE